MISPWLSVESHATAGDRRRDGGPSRQKSQIVGHAVENPSTGSQAPASRTWFPRREERVGARRCHGRGGLPLL